jgi:NADP-dependent 3-hydroxy acid dehydrogenase YdfG
LTATRIRSPGLKTWTKRSAWWRREAVRCHTAIVDVRERSAVWKAIEDGVNELGRVDTVVANAGICAMGKGQTIQSWSDTIDTDLAT